MSKREEREKNGKNGVIDLSNITNSILSFVVGFAVKKGGVLWLENLPFDWMKKCDSIKHTFFFLSSFFPTEKI